MNFLKSRLTALSFSAITASPPARAISKCKFGSQFKEVTETANYEKGTTYFWHNAMKKPGIFGRAL
ncbi:hypothetical protein GCM10007094_42440 [Pseudovibrio japonicus]|uniref:Uncharacterized protein n=1 Tax=Pseudovibrio japonicus TaxID=366534 RepID=A0ABQ3ESQ6_9HYPH|nr:hypothetical protein [Pseudovibrio japonicus]GHB48676.1 hypothetical protein GCM10007094_42440 [Pseudovibrio japonicus]